MNLNTTKLEELLATLKKKEEEKDKNTVLWVLAIIGAVFANGYVNNKVMEFVGDGVANLSADYRIGVDVMTTETTCLSSIWTTDDKIKEFYEIHKRPESYKELKPADVAYYDGGLCGSVHDQANDRNAIPSKQCLHDRGVKCRPHGYSG